MYVPVHVHVPGGRYLGRSLYRYVYVYTTSSSTGTTVYVRNPVSGYQNCSVLVHLSQSVLGSVLVHHSEARSVCRSVIIPQFDRPTEQYRPSQLGKVGLG